MPKLSPRVVFVTGASSGIGRALAEVFGGEGDVIVAIARRMKPLKELEKSVRAGGGICYPLGCDVRNARHVRSAVALALRRAGTIDVLINNAGITSFKDFLHTSVNEFRDVVETNLTGMFAVTREILPTMLRRGRGLIVNILSYAAQTTYTGSTAYSASKAGSAAMMKVLREELRREGIRVVNVYPGAVLSPMWHRQHRKKYGRQMMGPQQLAAFLYQVSRQPTAIAVEEVVLRPPYGDLKL